MGWFSGIGKGGTVGMLGGAGIGFLVGGPAGAAVGAGIGGQLGSNYDNNKAIDDQNRYNWDVWLRQQEYNTPANQVARLRAAGLNPNLFYSQGNVGNATSAPTMQAHSYNAVKVMDLMAMSAQVQNMREQNKNLRAQNNNLNATTRSIELDNEIKARDLEVYRKYGLIPNGGTSKQLQKLFMDIFGVNYENTHGSGDFARHIGNTIVDRLSDLLQGGAVFKPKSNKPISEYADYLRSRF